MKALRCAGAAAVLLALAACGSSGEDELNLWMAEQRAQTRPRVTPISEPKQFKPEAYAQEGATDPFNQLKLTQALRRDSAHSATNSVLITPELARRKEALEAYPLDAMAMVGSLDKADQITALLQVDKLLYQVRVGHYLGQNYGRITKITETGIVLREIVQDATGDWIERATTLELQERAK